MNTKGEMVAWKELAKHNDLAMWIVLRYKGEEWFTSLARRWGTSSRMIRFFVEGRRPLSAAVLYQIQQDTNLPMATLWEQCFLWKQKQRRVR